MITVAAVLTYLLIAALVLRSVYPKLSWIEDTGTPLHDPSAEWMILATAISFLWPVAFAIIIVAGLGQLIRWLLWPKGIHAKQEAAFKSKQAAEEERKEKERIAKEEGWAT